MSSTEPSFQSPTTPQLGKFWTFPNMLSLFRFVLALPMGYLILIDQDNRYLLPILVLFLIAAATDYFDGRLARWSHTVSDWGKVLDPLSDKFSATVVVLALVIRGSLPVWFFVLIAVRDLLIVLGGIYLGRRTGLVLMSIWSGKVAVTGVAITALAGLLRADPEILQFCIWATTALMIYSFIRYIFRFVQLHRKARQLELAEGARLETDAPSE